MPNQIPPWQETQILAMALANPGLGPRRLAAQLALEQSLTVSASGVLRVLRRHGLGTRLRRLSLVSGYAAPPQPERPRHPSIATSKLNSLAIWSSSTASTSAA